MMLDSKFDLDPEALAWARAKVQAFIDKMRRFEEQASHSDPYSPARERQWRVFGNIVEMDFIGGKGCVIAAFDERLPSILPALDETTVRPEPDDPRRVDCLNCGTSNAKCREGVRRGNGACCSTCAYTENHPVVDAATNEIGRD